MTRIRLKLTPEDHRTLTKARIVVISVVIALFGAAMLLQAAIGDSSATRRPNSATVAPTIVPFVPDQIPLPESALLLGADDATASSASVAPMIAPVVPDQIASPEAALARDADDVTASIGNPDRDPRYDDHAVRQ